MKKITKFETPAVVVMVAIEDVVNIYVVEGLLVCWRRGALTGKSTAAMAVESILAKRVS